MTEYFDSARTGLFLSTGGIVLSLVIVLPGLGLALKLTEQSINLAGEIADPVVQKPSHPSIEVVRFSRGEAEGQPFATLGSFQRVRHTGKLR